MGSIRSLRRQTKFLRRVTNHRDEAMEAAIAPANTVSSAVRKPFNTYYAPPGMPRWLTQLVEPFPVWGRQQESISILVKIENKFSGRSCRASGSGL